MNKILVIGSGAWGTALSQVLLSNKENNVTVYGVNDFELNDLRSQKNTSFFYDYKLPFKYQDITNDIEIFRLKKFDYIIYAAPSEFIEEVLEKITKVIEYNFNFINAAKGFVINKNETIFNLVYSKKYKKIKNYACLLGPGFAIELVKKQFTVLNVLSKNKSYASKICKIFNNDYFIAVPSTLVEPGEIVSNMKNPLAIVVGLLKGLRVSINVISAFLSLGIQEIASLIKAMNLNTEAINLYCGIGDIFLTCSSTKSRNYVFGRMISKYSYANEAEKFYNKTVEGRSACLVANNLFEKYNVNSILFKGLKMVLLNKWSAKDFLRNIKISLLKL